MASKKESALGQIGLGARLLIGGLRAGHRGRPYRPSLRRRIRISWFAAISPGTARSVGRSTALPSTAAGGKLICNSGRAVVSSKEGHSRSAPGSSPGDRRQSSVFGFRRNGRPDAGASRPDGQGLSVGRPCSPIRTEMSTGLKRSTVSWVVRCEQSPRPWPSPSGRRRHRLAIAIDSETDAVELLVLLAQVGTEVVDRLDRGGIDRNPKKVDLLCRDAVTVHQPARDGQDRLAVPRPDRNAVRLSEVGQMTGRSKIGFDHLERRFDQTRT